MICADYARKQDALTRECLSGYYHGKLNEFLSEQNYNIGNTYRTCVIKHYEKGLGVGTWGQDKKIIASIFEEYGLAPDFYLKILIDEINLIKPTVIIAMGEFAMRTLTGKEGISKWRGSCIDIEPNLLAKLNCKPRVMIMQHLSIEHIDESQRYILRVDFKKTIEMLSKPHSNLHDYTLIIARNTNDYLRFRSQYPDNPPEITPDIETHHGFITCVGVTFDGKTACTIPLLGSKVELMEQCRMSNLLARDLQNPLIGKNNQNIGYDKRILQRFGYRVNPIIWDTMLAAHTIAPEYPKNLGFLTSIYTNLPYHKDEGKEFDPSKHSYDQLYEYCGKDTITTKRIRDAQAIDLEEMEMTEFFNDFVMRLFNLYYENDSVGFLISDQKRSELGAKYEGMINLKIMELNSITDPVRLNLNSPSQIGKWMELMEFPVYRHRVDSGFMAVNTDVKSMKKMRSKDPKDWRKCKVPYEQAIRFLNLTLLIRRIEKILEYISVGVHPCGRVFTGSKIAATTSGRTAAGMTADRDYVWVPDKKSTHDPAQSLKNKSLGFNFQTVTKHGFIIEGDDDEDIDEGIIGKDVREMLIADPNMVIVEIDRSQAEARVVDLLAEDYESLEEYGKLDKHCKVASYVFTDYTYEDIFRLSKIEKTEQGLYMRHAGKQGKHASNLDIGEYMLSDLMNITLKEAKLILTKINAAYPQTKTVFHAQVEEQVRKTRTMVNPYGRVRRFFKKLDGHGIKVALSWYPQSVISDGTKLAKLKIGDYIDQTKAWLVAENHDSITALVKRGYIRQYVSIAKRHLEEEIDFRKGTFFRDYMLKIPAEVSVGRRDWGHMKELKLKKMRIAA